MEIGHLVINPGVFYVYYGICFSYAAYRFYLVSKKGNALAVDITRAIAFYALALFTVSAGLLFFLNRPYEAAVVTKIIGFGLWYTALVMTTPVFCKIVAPRIPQKYIAGFFIVFGLSLITYHLSRLVPLTVRGGVPAWQVDPLVSFLEGTVTVTYYTVIGVAYGWQASKAGHVIRGVLFATGAIFSSLFMPLTYAVHGRAEFLVVTAFCVAGQTILTVSVLSNVLSLKLVRYFGDEPAPAAVAQGVIRL